MTISLGIKRKQALYSPSIIFSTLSSIRLSVFPAGVDSDIWVISQLHFRLLIYSQIINFWPLQSLVSFPNDVFLIRVFSDFICFYLLFSRFFRLFCRILILSMHQICFHSSESRIINSKSNNYHKKLLHY